MPQEFLLWTRETAAFWFALAIPVIIWLGMGFLLPSPELQIRSTGLALQISGLIIISFGLNALRTELRHDGQGFGTAIFDSLKRLGRIFYPIRRHATTTLGAGHVSAKGQMVGISVKSGDLTGRVDALEQELRSIRENISDMEKDTASRLNELSERSEKNHQSLKDYITSAHLQGLTPELVAIAWIILGVGLSSFPLEIAATFGLG